MRNMGTIDRGMRNMGTVDRGMRGESDKIV